MTKKTFLESCGFTDIKPYDYRSEDLPDHGLSATDPATGSTLMFDVKLKICDMAQKIDESRRKHGIW